MSKPDKHVFFYPIGDALGLNFVGVSHNPTGKHYGYIASRFRPLVERKTDISIFTRMLNKNKQPERV